MPGLCSFVTLRHFKQKPLVLSDLPKHSRVHEQGSSIFCFYFSFGFIFAFIFLLDLYFAVKQTNKQNDITVSVISNY